VWFGWIPKTSHPPYQYHHYSTHEPQNRDSDSLSFFSFPALINVPTVTIDWRRFLQRGPWQFWRHRDTQMLIFFHDHYTLPLFLNLVWSTDQYSSELCRPDDSDVARSLIHMLVCLLVWADSDIPTSSWPSREFRNAYKCHSEWYAVVLGWPGSPRHNGTQAPAMDIAHGPRPKLNLNTEPLLIFFFKDL